jgi:hypothetical protein
MPRNTVVFELDGWEIREHITISNIHRERYEHCPFFATHIGCDPANKTPFHSGVEYSWVSTDRADENEDARCYYCQEELPIGVLALIMLRNCDL